MRFDTSLLKSRNLKHTITILVHLNESMDFHHVGISISMEHTTIVTIIVHNRGYQIPTRHLSDTYQTPIRRLSETNRHLTDT
jgi:hypothetical protein